MVPDSGSDFCQVPVPVSDPAPDPTFKEVLATTLDPATLVSASTELRGKLALTS